MSEGPTIGDWTQYEWIPGDASSFPARVRLRNTAWMVYYEPDVVVQRMQAENAKLREERDHWHVEQVHAYGNWEDAHKRAIELEKQNAKLRDLMYERAHVYAIQHMTEDELRITATNVMEDNAKLRELIRMMWKPFCWAQSGYDVCLTDEQDKAIRDMVRELGVEVDE